MTSRRALALAPAALMLIAWTAAARPARAETRRYAVVIGSNVGDPQEPRLRYAEADATKIAQTLRSVGDFAASQTLQLAGVPADEVRRALIELNARLRQESADTLLFVYYSGARGRRQPAPGRDAPGHPRAAGPAGRVVGRQPRAGPRRLPLGRRHAREGRHADRAVLGQPGPALAARRTGHHDLQRRDGRFAGI